MSIVIMAAWLVALVLALGLTGAAFLWFAEQFWKDGD